MPVKLVYALHRLPHLSRDEFHAYWRGTHGPLVAERKEVLRIRQYHQLHTVEEQGGLPSFDGVAELWWDSLEDFRAVAASPEGAKALAELHEDEKQFIDHTRSPVWWANENKVIDSSLHSL